MNVSAGGAAAPPQASSTFFDEFHPVLLKQHEGLPSQEYDTFDRAVDVFFSEMEAQKLEMRTLQVRLSSVSLHLLGVHNTYAI